MKKKGTRLAWLWLLLALLLGSVVSAAVPKMDAPITQANVLALAKGTNADSAYILQYAVNRGEPILTWWQGSSSLTAGMDTGVHESVHGYSFSEASINSEAIYIGNQKSIRVPYTNVFRSKQMSTSIPKKLRTFRWDTYVGHPSANLASDVYGVYGLLNEFMAYCWGMNAEMALFDYYKAQNATPQNWLEFINGGANGRQSYAEFKYYILHYLVYAKQHYPSIYRGIIENRNFLNAYQTIERKYAKLITKYEKRLKDIKSLLEKQGCQVEFDGSYFRIHSNGHGHGTGLFTEEYQRLITEMQKPAYQEIFRGEEPKNVEKTSISSAKAAAGGIKLSWKKAAGANGYEIYRKASGDTDYRKVNTTSGTSWTDKTVKSGTPYSYKIIAYAKSGNSVVKADASAVKTTVWVKAPTGLSLTANGKMALTVKWKKVSGTDGYQISYATDSSFASAKTVSVKASAVTAKIRSLKKNTTYYIKVRAFRKSAGNTYYSAWSAVKQKATGR